MPAAATPSSRKSEEQNRPFPEDLPVHDWYRFVLSYPPHLVRDYLERFELSGGECVLDPFCGTGTTVVECKKRGVPSIGIEANPVAHFAAAVKTEWRLDANGLEEHAQRVADAAITRLAQEGISDDPFFASSEVSGRSLRTLSEEEQKLLITNSISPLPLHKTLTLLECLEEYRDPRFERHERLALAKAVVFSISNLRFGPEVGVGKAKPDTPVVGAWLRGVSAMAADLRRMQERPSAPASVVRGDARHEVRMFEPASIDAVITSPPYPNEKDYSRTTRLEAVLLGFIRSRKELRAMKQQLLCSNTRNVYKEDPDERWVAHNTRIQLLADEIEAQRKTLGKTSGFERLYAKVTRLYFGGMARHFAELKYVLRPGARLAYVVGDQASYFRVMIRTGQLLAEIGEELGYEVVGIDLFRTRFSTATKDQLREEVVLLRWPGEVARPSHFFLNGRGK